MVSYEDLVKLTWQEFEHGVTEVSSKISSKPNEFAGIIAISRSGNILGTMLACKLNIPIRLIHFKAISQPNGPRLLELQSLDTKFISEISTGQKILIVDSKIYSGNTITRTIEEINQIRPDLTCEVTAYDADITTTNRITKTHTLHTYQTSNDRRLLSSIESKNQNISNQINIYPWEDLDQEWKVYQRLNEKYGSLMIA